VSKNKNMWFQQLAFAMARKTSARTFWIIWTLWKTCLQNVSFRISYPWKPKNWAEKLWEGPLLNKIVPIFVSSFLRLFSLISPFCMADMWKTVYFLDGYMVTLKWITIHTKASQILGVKVQNIVATATCRPRFVHLWCRYTVCGGKVRRKFGSKKNEVTWDWRTHSFKGDLHNLIWMLLKWSTQEAKRWAEHVAYMGKTNGYKISIMRPQGMTALVNRPKCRWDGN
jgi:hypothetical protein